MTTRTPPDVELPETPTAQVQGYGSFTVFLPGDHLRDYRIGDEVTVHTKTDVVKATLTGRTQGSLFSLVQMSGMTYAPVRNKPYDPIAFADALEANLPDETDVCDIRGFFTVLTFDGVQVPATPMPMATPNTAPISGSA